MAKLKKESFVLMVNKAEIRGKIFFARTGNPDQSPGLIICHGIPAGDSPGVDTGNRSGYEELAAGYSGFGYNTVIFNFSGTGKSGGNLDLLQWINQLEEVLRHYYCRLSSYKKPYRRHRYPEPPFGLPPEPPFGLPPEQSDEQSSEQPPELPPEPLFKQSSGPPPEHSPVPPIHLLGFSAGAAISVMVAAKAAATTTTTTTTTTATTTTTTTTTTTSSSAGIAGSKDIADVSGTIITRCANPGKPSKATASYRPASSEEALCGAEAAGRTDMGLPVNKQMPEIASLALCACPANFSFLIEKFTADGIWQWFNTSGFFRDAMRLSSKKSWLKNMLSVKPEEKIGGLTTGKILLIHGEKDDLVPVEHAFTLRSEASIPVKTVILPEEGHQLRHSGKVQSLLESWFKNIKSETI